MKNVVARTLASLFLGVLALGSTSQAQNAERSIKANIPFEFNVGSQTFPAGNYRLVSKGAPFLQLRDTTGHVLATVLTNSVRSLDDLGTSRLRFNLEDGHYALAQVWQQSSSSGEQLQLRKRSSKIAKIRNTPSGTQTVAASNSQ